MRLRYYVFIYLPTKTMLRLAMVAVGHAFLMIDKYTPMTMSCEGQGLCSLSKYIYVVMLVL